ncbi:MAG: DUF6537 domain-containing protein [Caulobacteraceae bacterium]
MRGGPLDVFGMTGERRAERKLLADYEAGLDRLLAGLTPERLPLAVKIASVPDAIRGFGHVKEAAMATAKADEAKLWAEWDGLTRFSLRGRTSGRLLGPSGETAAQVPSAEPARVGAAWRGTAGRAGRRAGRTPRRTRRTSTPHGDVADKRQPWKVAQSVVKVGPPRRWTMFIAVVAIGRSWRATAA